MGLGVEMDTHMVVGRDTTASGKWGKGDRGLGSGGGRVGVEMDTSMFAGPDTTASGKWEKGDRGLAPGWRGGGGRDGHVYGCMT